MNSNNYRIMIFILTSFIFFAIPLKAQNNKVNEIVRASSKVKSTSADSLNQFVPLSEFTYGGDQRYTMDGSMPRLKTKIKPTTLEIMSGIYLGAVVGLHIHQNNAWWSGQRRSFHIQEAWAFGYQANIAGHAFGGYVCSYVMSEGLMASGFSWDAATFYGTIFGALYQT